MVIDSSPATRFVTGPVEAGEVREREARPMARLGRYLVFGLLGRGGMGVVYAAFDERLRRRVAIKQTDRRSVDALSWQRSLREAQALARLAHPNVVTVYEAFELDDKLCIVMEFVAGQTLRQWLADTRPSPDAVFAALVQVGRGIAAAHSTGIIHRDLKPDNIMIGSDGRARLIDFGLARVLDGRQEPLEFAVPRGDDQTPAAATRSGAVVGTPGYMAPEQELGSTVDERSDLFSYCVLAFEALHGARPHDGCSEKERRTALLAGRIVELADSKVPAWLDAVIRRGLAVEPENRWPSMEALLDALDGPLERRRRYP